MDNKKDYNPFRRLWLQFEANELLTMKMLEWFKLVEICMVKVLKFVEHEWCFNTLAFMKNKMHN